MSKRTFTVVEYGSHYSVRHNRSGREAVMGDGVDVVFDKDGHALSPGTEKFRRQWQRDLNASAEETMEAYFRRRC